MDQETVAQSAVPWGYSTNKLQRSPSGNGFAHLPTIPEWRRSLPFQVIPGVPAVDIPPALRVSEIPGATTALEHNRLIKIP